MLKYVRRARAALRRIKPETRARVYQGLVLATPTIAAALKLAPDEADLYLQIAGLVLLAGGGTLAAANTPSAPDR